MTPSEPSSPRREGASPADRRMSPTPPRRTGTRPPRHPTARTAAAGVLAGALLALGLGGPTPLGASEVHEEAVLESPASTVAAGGELRLVGRDFAAGEDHRLRLVGALEEHDLGKVSPDTAGTFEVAVRIPDEVDPGRYRVEAVAPDGDVAARLSLTVVAGSAAEGDGASDDMAGAAADGGAGASTAEATAEHLEIDRSRSGLEWTVILVLLGAAVGTGGGLLRRSA